MTTFDPETFVRDNNPAFPGDKDFLDYPGQQANDPGVWSVCPTAHHRSFAYRPICC